MARREIVRAYRHILRQSLRAIHFSKPARVTLQDRLRLAFRQGNAQDFDRRKIANTLEFLRYAAAENGLEHKILKNLLYIWWHEFAGDRRTPRKLQNIEEVEMKATAYDNFVHHIRMLNEDMGMCIPTTIIRGAR
ncbi:DUF1763-domain-containing protein [Sporormia fimetaria CBS 119925]|uniref:DUF1763-domain-containing protein n=1 Tax=Sporormia fimetaria CBS 119925 TaxID=1340428 RepID=A0A6A6VAV1_9PLEO|nr:DUF1763-domain-containing protein [Sporormia fimetaria CBS 119925]